MRQVLRNNALTRPFYVFAREMYRTYHRTKTQAMDKIVALGTRGRPSRSFVWNGLTLKEGAKHHWKAAAIADDLREYRNIVEAITGLLADRRDPVLFDIGANLGIFTYLFAGIPGARVYTFEPVTYTFNYLNENIETNNLTNVRCFNMGVSDSRREMFISTTANAPGMGHFSVNV